MAFLDVLGFSQLVREADTDVEKRDLIKSIIRALRDRFNEVPAYTGFRFTQFSDCIVLSADQTEPGLVAVATGCVSLAGGLMARGVLLRGGIAVGNILHTEDALFGTGLLKAYNADNSGTPPRIALCPDTCRDAEGFGLSGLIRADPLDLTLMLHTLWEYETYDGTAGADPDVAAEGARVARHISDNGGDMRLPSSVRAK